MEMEIYQILIIRKNESAELKVSTRAGAKPATPADVKLVEKDGEFTISWGAAETEYMPSIVKSR